MIELEHSPLGGSAAKRFLSCTGSFLLQKQEILNGTFENVPSEFAERGTGAHELGAVCLATDAEPYEFIGQKFNGFIAGWPSGIELDAVTAYVNECRSIIDHCGDDGRAIVEQTFKAKHLHPLLKGTVDFGYLSPSRGIFLRDYKNGEGVGVSAFQNDQLRYYAFLLIVNCWLDVWEYDTPVNLGIVQPNFYGLYEEPEIWITTVGEIMDWGENVLLPRMRLLMTDLPIRDADFVPGDHCQFCPVLLECPKMRAAFDTYVNAGEDFITMLSNEELDRLYAVKDHARRFMNALESTVHSRLVTGGKIASAKLVEKRVNREWKPGAAAALTEALGEAAYSPRKIKSPAQVEKMSSRGKELATEYGYKPDSFGYSVAPIDDPRPEAKVKGNADVFAGFAAPEPGPIAYGEF